MKTSTSRSLRRALLAAVALAVALLPAVAGAQAEGDTTPSPDEPAGVETAGTAEMRGTPGTAEPKGAPPLGRRPRKQARALPRSAVHSGTETRSPRTERSAVATPRNRAPTRSRAKKKTRSTIPRAAVAPSPFTAGAAAPSS